MHYHQRVASCTIINVLRHALALACSVMHYHQRVASFTIISVLRHAPSLACCVMHYHQRIASCTIISVLHHALYDQHATSSTINSLAVAEPDALML